MLKLMRDQFKSLKIILWFVVFIFVLLIFVDWGAGRVGGSRQGMEGIAARIGGTTIKRGPVPAPVCAAPTSASA